MKPKIAHQVWDLLDQMKTDLGRDLLLQQMNGKSLTEEQLQQYDQVCSARQAAFNVAVEAYKAAKR